MEEGKKGVVKEGGGSGSLRPNLHGSSKSFRRMLRVVQAIDRFTVGCGKVICWLILPMVISLVYEVFARYLFTAPTIWANDISTMLYGIFWMAGAAFALQGQLHIRTDFLYEKWSTRTKGIVDAILYLSLYFPGLVIFLWIGWEYAWRSFLFGERIISSPWMPIIWPVKMTIPIATVLLLIQGVSELLKSLYAASAGVSMEEKREAMEI
jgi:TRAP-type mannitol/chloroaromatic compound transport system permease small subunit